MRTTTRAALGLAALTTCTVTALGLDAAAAPAAPAGARFIDALAEQRFDAARALLAPDVEFQAITPSAGYVDLDGRDAVMKLMREWYAPAEAAESIRTGTVVDRRWVHYRIRWSSPADGTMVFAQRAFYDLAADGRISAIQLVCSGDRKVDG